MKKTTAGVSNTPEVTIVLRRHPQLGYCWDLGGNRQGHETTGAGGYESLQEMMGDIAFIEMLQTALGSDAVPPDVVAYARERAATERQPIPDEVVDALKQALGDRVKDLRTK